MLFSFFLKATKYVAVCYDTRLQNVCYAVKQTWTVVPLAQGSILGLRAPAPTGTNLCSDELCLYHLQDVSQLHGLWTQGLIS